MSIDDVLCKKYYALSQNIFKIFTNMFYKYNLMVPQLGNR